LLDPAPGGTGVEALGGGEAASLGAAGDDPGHRPSAHARQPEPSLPAALLEEVPQGRGTLARGLLDPAEGLGPCPLEQIAVADQVSDAEGGHPPLPGAEEVAGSADLQVLLRDHE